MMNSLHLAKEEFLKYLDSMRGYSPLTIQSYDEAISLMIRESLIDNNIDGIEVNLMPFRLKIAHMNTKSVALKLSAVRSFVKFLRSQGMKIDLRGDESVKIPKSLPKPIAHEHVMNVLIHAEPMAKLAIMILYTMGLRISELCAVKLSDFSEGWLRIQGKGSKERDIPFLDHVEKMVQEYRKAYPSEVYLFETKGEKLSENSLRYTITKAFAAIGLKVTPHQLRHSYATELLNNGARIADVSELLGHESMATTQIYTKLGNALKMDHYRHAHPLCQPHEDSV